jgi:hypothetical protein
MGFEHLASDRIAELNPVGTADSDVPALALETGGAHEAEMRNDWTAPGAGPNVPQLRSLTADEEGAVGTEAEVVKVPGMPGGGCRDIPRRDFEDACG